MRIGLEAMETVEVLTSEVVVPAEETQGAHDNSLLYFSRILLYDQYVKKNPTITCGVAIRKTIAQAYIPTFP